MNRQPQLARLLLFATLVAAIAHFAPALPTPHVSLALATPHLSFAVML